jgi:hypothetical protein
MDTQRVQPSSERVVMGRCRAFSRRRRGREMEDEAGNQHHRRSSRFWRIAASQAGPGGRRMEAGLALRHTGPATDRQKWSLWHLTWENAPLAVAGHPRRLTLAYRRAQDSGSAHAMAASPAAASSRGRSYSHLCSSADVHHVAVSNTCTVIVNRQHPFGLRALLPCPTRPVILT